MRTSVLLLTFNEAQNLPRCLDALSWCDDIVVVDSGSTDATVCIARIRGARVFHRAFDDFASQRNWGLEQCGLLHDWVLHLDADEVITREFRECLLACEAPSHVDAYYVPSKLMLFGTWLRRSGMYPVYQVRLGKRDVLRFKQVGHGQREALDPDRIAYFPEPYLHYSFSQGLAAWFTRHVRYAKDEAGLLINGRTHELSSQFLLGDRVSRRRRLKAWSSRIPLWLRPIMRFLYVYVFRRGFLDGAPGLTYAVMLGIYEGMTGVLAKEVLMTKADPKLDVTNEDKQ